MFPLFNVAKNPLVNRTLYRNVNTGHILLARLFLIYIFDVSNVFNNFFFAQMGRFANIPNPYSNVVDKETRIFFSHIAFIKYCSLKPLNLMNTQSIGLRKPRF